MKIGVSGASGQLGRATIEALVARKSGAQIVAVTRTPEALGVAGVEARHGDYDKPETLAAAYKGLDKLMIIPTTDLRPGVRGSQNIAAIDAAVAAGVGHITFLSSAGNRNVAEPHIWASYYRTEQHLMAKAKAWSVLRMNYYAEALLQEAQMSLAHGVLTGLAENKVAFVSRLDLAAAAAGLLSTDGHDGAIYNGTGPASVSGAERAALVAKLSGKPMNFLVLPPEALRGGLAQAGLPAEVVDTVLAIQDSFAKGGFDVVTGDIEKLSGQPPRTLEAALAGAF